MSDNLQELRPRHHEIIRLHLQGLSNVQIASVLSLHTNTVSRCIRDWEAQRIINNEQERRTRNVQTISDRISKLTSHTFDLIEEAINEGTLGGPEAPVSNKQRLDLMKYIVRCSGHGPVTRVQGKHEHDHFLNAGKIRKIRQLAERDCIMIEDQTDKQPVEVS